MIILLNTRVNAKDKELLEKKLRALGAKFRTEKLRSRIAVILEGYSGDFPKNDLYRFGCVDKVIEPADGYFLASAEFTPRWKRFALGGRREWTRGELLLCAGPCAVEGEKLLDEMAKLRRGEFDNDLLPSVIANKKLNYYKLTFEVTDLTTGLLVYTAEEEFARQESEPLIGW